MSLTNSPSKGRNKEMDSLDCLQLGYRKKKKKLGKKVLVELRNMEDGLCTVWKKDMEWQKDSKREGGMEP